MTPEEEITWLHEQLMDVTAHLAGAASAYRVYARRDSSVGRALTDPFFTTRAEDFRLAAARAQTAARESHARQQEKTNATHTN